jgi:ADP-glucose type glycogen/starch synthase
MPGGCTRIGPKPGWSCRARSRQGLQAPHAAIDMDRSPHASAMDAKSAAFDDPTLGGVGDAAAVDPVFPDTVEHAHFVLYQAMDGGLQLRWHLDALSLAYARDAFGKGSDAPTPVLRLHRLNGEGGSQVIADAPLDDRDLTVDGLADCEADAANGLLQAEIGLSNAAGGWVLVARSNRMQTIMPVGASFLREPEPPLRAPLWAQVDTVAASLGQTLLSGARPPALQQAGVAPGTFPLVEPEPGAGTDAMPPIALKRVSSPAHGDGAPGQRDRRNEGKKEGKSEGQLEGNKAKMYIVMASPECAPVAKAGGLGDFVRGSPGSWRSAATGGDRAAQVRQPALRPHLGHAQGLHRPAGALLRHHIHCDVEYGEADGLKCFFIDAHSQHGFFNRGKIYGDADDPDRFAFFSRAVMEFLYKSGKRPDIIHCNDWHTGLMPVLLYEIYAGLGMDRTRVCYSLHNMGHQGWAGPACAAHERPRRRPADGPGAAAGPGQSHAVNLMKGGIVFSNFVTTVSPRYAWEIQHTDQGMGLQGCCRTHDRKFGGVLNGIDYSTWNPEIDPHPASTTAPTPAGKGPQGGAARSAPGSPTCSSRIVAVVSRLDRQKGVELIRHGIYYALEQGCQFVLLGSAPDPK